MKKILIIILLIVAVPLYLWNMYMIAGPVFIQKPSDNKMSSDRHDTGIDLYLMSLKPLTFTPSQRSPFAAYKENPKPVAVKVAQSKVPRPVTPDVPPPQVTVNGIMWNPQKPIAMLGLPDGSSVTATVNQSFGDFTVTKIEQTRVMIKYAGGTVWVER